MMFIFVFLFIGLLQNVVGELDVVDVPTTLGTIRGTTLKSRLGKDFYAFRGIRYAEAPTGERRFKNPQPIAAWEPEVFDATSDGPMCPQVIQKLNELSEDCLRLNVYSKNLNGSLPVVVYIHTGVFYFFSGQSRNFAGPESIMDRDVVFVTMNYRLGTLGFLATGTKDAPGNAGLKDQVIALRWIKKHIKNFGGDPDSITLFGYGAGGMSVGLHMLSPMSEGLFNRGIIMSAFPTAQWEYKHSDMKLAKRQAALLNCPVEHPADIVKCLKTKSMEDFVDTTVGMLHSKWNPLFNWRPVIEDDFGQERFLVEHPYKTILTGNFHKVPLIMGVTELEYVGWPKEMLVNETIRAVFNDHFDIHAPIVLMYEENTPRSLEITKALRSKYSISGELEFPESMKGLGELYSDAATGFAFHRFLDLMSRFTPVYTYLFTYHGRYSHYRLPGNKTYGAVHHDELLYLLNVPIMTPLLKQTDPENEIIERLTRMWTEFAKKGDPNNPNDEFIKNANWKLYTKDKQEYLEIGDELTLREGGINTNRYQIWDELFPIPDADQFNSIY